MRKKVLLALMIFQFHKVQLKDSKLRTAVVTLNLFQFHKVQLKVPIR